MSAKCDVTDAGVAGVTSGGAAGLARQTAEGLPRDVSGGLVPLLLWTLDTHCNEIFFQPGPGSAKITLPTLLFRTQGFRSTLVK